MDLYYFPECPEAVLLKEFLKNKEGLKIEPIKDIRPWERFLVLNGSGENHYKTLEILRRVKPQVYLHIDNHPDLGRPSARPHDGNFLRFLPDYLEEVFVAGVSYSFSDVRGLVQVGGKQRKLIWDFFCNMKGNRELFKKLRILPGQEMLFQFTDFGKGDLNLLEANPSTSAVLLGEFETDERTMERLLEPPRLLAGFRGFRDIGNLLQGRSVYVSLDLDVLNAGEGIVTEYDKGCLRARDLIWLLRRVAESNKIVGMDICGLSGLEMGKEERRGSLRRLGRLIKEIRAIGE